MPQTAALLKELEQSHEQMARLAASLDWTNIVPLWQTVAPRVAELKEVHFDSLPANERTAACESLQKLLTHQNAVIGRIIPWMEQVRPLLKSLENHPMTTSDTDRKA